MMGYRIDRSDQKGLIVPAEKVPAFIDAYASAVCAECGHAWHADAAKTKTDGLSAFLEKVGYPFVLRPQPDGSVLLEYDDAYLGEIWHPEPVAVTVRALAPYVARGSYLGFVGEDLELWSYVFDGRGGYRILYPEIDWTSGKEAR